MASANGKPKAVSSLSDQWPSFLNATVAEVIKSDLGFGSMTPVQSAVIPILVNQHKDVVVEAVTGSGKTLAFVIPVLEILLKRSSEFANKKHNIGALIVTPTRELASQIFEVVGAFLARLSKFKAVLFVGGNKIDDDIGAFRAEGGNIVVCTPGRFEDLLNQKGGTRRLNLLTHLKSLEVLILDEADRLLDLGFSESLLNIIKALPKQRRTGLFSATQTDEIDKLIKVGLRNPCVIQVKQKGNASAQKTPTTLNNYYQVTEPELKFNQLLNFLCTNAELKIIVFMSTCAEVEYFAKLVKAFIPDTNVLSMHRKIKSKRNKVFNEFKNFKKGILLCTDILSRGIDIEDVDWVVQYDPPKFANSFVHRCGRTARSGRVGDALLYLLPNEDCYVQFLNINQHVPLTPYKPAADSDKFKLDKTMARIRGLALKDRDLYELGKQAFVSFIKAYSKHECSHIFKVKELDFSNLAKGYGLLHVPKMPEIKQEAGVMTKFVDDLDISTIPYKDKAKEKLRLKKLEQRKKDLESGKPLEDKRKRPTESVAWSNQKERKLKRKIRKEKHSLAEKKRKNEFDQEEFDELQSDFKLLKKLKKKKISEETFDKEFLDSD